jgi:IS5 family transposase
LGLAAQRHEIEAFGEREGFAVRSWHQDVQTGAGADALQLRPGLASALKEAKWARCPLIVSRLDRLSRNEHFSVDGTLIESWAAVKSMRRRDGKDEPPGPGRNPSVDWHGEKRTNETHVSPADPQAKLYRKADKQPAKLYYMGHVLMDHREGPAVDVELTEANGFAEREAALAMLDRHPSQQQRTLAADKAYDSADFIADCRKRRVTPHVAMNITEQRDSAIDARTTRHPGYVVSQRIRKRIEECFGWGKDGRPPRKMKVVGKEKVTFLATLTVGCYTLLRLAKLLAGPQLAPA